MRLVLLALAAIWLPIKIGQWGGALLNDQDRHEHLRTWVAVEEGTHGLLATAICLPLFWNRRRAPFLIIPFLLATAPDFDHLVTAREKVQSLSTDEAPRSDLEYVAIGTRGFTHSLVITYIAAGVLLVLSRRLDWAWVLAMARTSHIIRDAHTAPLAMFFPNPTEYELGLWAYLYWHSALGAMTFGLMFVYEPVNAFLRRIARAFFGLLVPSQPSPDWNSGGSVPPVRRSHYRHSTSRHSPSHDRSPSGHSAHSRSARHHRHHHSSRSPRDDDV